ncbi:HDL135Cp [Eremothecium sinecaudum]|uniref:DNA helicase n=1 Tax=Eremothecium sinecaudum TaxID=45286 RepID=A0A0X8HSD9_9SACH|nr:HDL135Cp [Eremothecium sinecaudum]AMD20609.1 HDL135Cp [Eremothecium sinecaudum]
MDSEDLRSLDAAIVSQDSLERKIETNAEKFINQHQLEQEEARLSRYTEKLKLLKHRVATIERNIQKATRISVRARLREQVLELKEKEIKPLLDDINDIKERIKDIKKDNSSKSDSVDADGRRHSESERDFLIRTGKITAFGNLTEFKIEDEVTTENTQKIIEEDGIIQPENNDEAYSSDNPEVDEIVLSDEGVINVEEDIDDGIEEHYQKRLKNWVAKRSAQRTNDPHPDWPEWEKPNPLRTGAELNGGFKIPGEIFTQLFNYQKTCVQWLYELYQQKSGGILGDEMGLGKTIQIIAFLASLHHSRKLDGPILVVCPATVMKQWCNEIHSWWPPLRTIILHSIGSGMVNKKRLSEDQMEELFLTSSRDELSYDQYSDDVSFHRTRKQLEAKYGVSTLIKRVIEQGHILISTYVGLRIHADELLNVKWGYVVLDEGHKIRNPDSEIALTCKQLKTHHRVILSGTPIQNNLTELWSLFDFIFPGKLGTLPIFQQQFSIPINTAGYANATNMQVQTGYKCAVALKDLISPYLLRRVKSDVAKDLPKKNEMVLFCKMTQFQREKYLQFLNSDELVKIKNGKRQVLYGIDILRKICNHPDLLEREFIKQKRSYGDPKRSGKMQTVKQLLVSWRKQGHKALLFTQSRQMLDILEKAVTEKYKDLSDLKYLRMDGTTNIAKRQNLVDKFNNEDYDLFLLTTRVGGLGVNLTGANRIIIFDPDWNPSTDLQARERAWRIGQKREVIIYRLMISGSIEEKIYHRQIFKQFLTNKVLNNPKQKRFFKMNELHDLFSLGNEHSFANEEFSQEVKKQTQKMIKDTAADADDFNEIVNFEGVAKLEGFYSSKEQKEKQKDEDSRLLEGLFSGGDVTNAETNNFPPHFLDPATDNNISKEASRVAENAVAMLRKSRKITKRFEVGTPTWTGKFGNAGRIKKKKSNQTNSSTLLAKFAESSNTIKNISIDDNVVDNYTEILGRTQDYLKKRPDFFSKSEDIMKTLGVEIRNKEELMRIRALLKEIATFDKAKLGWVLKSEFRDRAA